MAETLLRACKGRDIETRTVLDAYHKTNDGKQQNESCEVHVDHEAVGRVMKGLI